MKFYRYTSLITLLACACTFAPQDGSMNPEFHPPLTYESWHVNHYTTANGIKACAITSGYNGLIVTVGQVQNGKNDVVVASNRMMQPGATLTVNVGGINYETYDTYFSPDLGRKLVDALTKNDKAYLEWSEFSGSSSRERVHVQNTVKLSGFSSHLKECRASLQ